MKWFLVGLLLLFIGAWFLNYPILSGRYDLESCAQQYYFWISREIVYEFMMLFLAGVCFFTGSGLIKAFSCFIVIIITGDLVDKLVFGITDYVLGDIVLILVGIIVSVIVWKKSGKASGT